MLMNKRLTEVVRLQRNHDNESLEPRLRHLEEQLLRHTHNETPSSIRTEEQVKQMRGTLEKIESTMVTKDEFAPVKMLVFGLVGLILTAVIGALVSLVVLQP